MKNKIMLLFVVASLLLASCTITDKIPDGKGNDAFTSQDIKKFNSKEELVSFLDSVSRLSQYNYLAKGISFSETRDLAVQAIGGADESMPAKAASDYSTTNIQVAGVDEADFIKNDGKYIYMISQNRLLIVDAYPAEDAEILSETRIKGNALQMFNNKDRLVIFAETNDEIPIFSEYDYMPRPIFKQKTHAMVYDISDKKNPNLIKDYDVKGNYFSSRMIGDSIYLIVQDNVYYYNKIIDMPAVAESSKIMVYPDIYYFDNPEINYNFNTIVSFDMFEADSLQAKTFMMGYSNNIYVSEDSIYITYQKNLPYVYYQKHNEDRFYEVVVPLLPSETRRAIESIKNDNSLSQYEKWNKISSELESMYNSMDEDEKSELLISIEKAITEYELKLEEDRRKTVIHKISISNGNIDYKAKAEVKGYVLNQFSMDESESYFRIATTVEGYTSNAFVQYNNVYVLDDGLGIVGSLENIAPEERIYSTRFIGDRLYMVTFKRIDPFFAIDLSDPRNPSILGKLKIPGFSDYLHPYDSNHIIGIGKETGENEFGGISVKGVKLALFDVSDVSNPRQVGKYEIGQQGTDSEALYEPKAFLFDKEKNLLVIPVTVQEKTSIYDERYGYYRQKIWQGAYVFGLTPEEGFDLKGKISHSEYEGQYQYYGSPYAVRRSLYMDDVLYTVSMKKIKMNDRSDIGKELNEIQLPYESYPGPYTLYGIRGSIGESAEGFVPDSVSVPSIAEQSDE